MPITVKQNKNGGYAILRATANDTINLVTAAGSNETVQSMSVAEIKWSTVGSAYWTLTRGSNVIGLFGGSGSHDYQESGMRLEATNSQLTANCNVTLTGSIGTIVVKLHKVSGE